MKHWWLALLLAGCSYTFDSQAPDLPLVGAPPSTTSLPKLNRQPAQQVAIVSGVDDALWVAIGEPMYENGMTRSGLRVVRLAEPPDEELVVADRVQIGWKAFYLTTFGMMENELVVVSAGQKDGGAKFKFQPGPALLLAGGNDTVFAYLAENPQTVHYDVVQRDGSYKRALPLPMGLNPLNPTENVRFFFNGDGSRLYVRDGNGLLVWYATRSEDKVELGVQPRLMLLDEGRGVLIACGSRGLNAVRIDGSGETVLDPTPCGVNGSLWERGDKILYGAAGELREVPIDASAAPRQVLAGGLRVLSIGPKNDIVYSRDPSNRYIHGAGDGWLGDWRFMERGREPTFSDDGMRLRWLEHAAVGNGAGDLLSAEIGGSPLRLARNVWQYDDLGRGRVLAASNQAFLGTQNRIVVIDEKKKEARWVADSASEYMFLPGTDELLVDVVTGPSTFDVVRVKIPPP